MLNYWRGNEIEAINDKIGNKIRTKEEKSEKQTTRWIKTRRANHRDIRRKNRDREEEPSKPTGRIGKRNDKRKDYKKKEVLLDEREKVKHERKRERKDQKSLTLRQLYTLDQFLH